ncbi:MAG: hypothetical protein ACRDNW_22815, partial [Trebonia sp.]
MSIGMGTGAAQRQLNPQEEPPRRSGKAWKLALAGLIGVYVTLGGYDLIVGSGQLGLGTAVSANSASSAPRPATPATSETSTAPQPAKASNPAPAATPSAADLAAPHPLGVVSIAAFGPDGTSDGDNPGTAYRILD